MDLELKDRVFVVTGGARGLGRATADVPRRRGRPRGRLGPLRGVPAPRSARRSATRWCPSSPTTPTRDTPSRLIGAARERWGRLDGALISVGGPPTGPVTAIDDDQWTVGLRVGLPRRCPALPRDRRRRCGDGGSLALVLSSSVGAARRPGHLQRAAPGSGDGRQDAGRRARPARHPGQRAAARPGRHRPGRRARRRHRRRRGRPGTPRSRRSRWAATASRRSSAGSRRSCCRRRRRSSPA